LLCSFEDWRVIAGISGGSGLIILGLIILITFIIRRRKVPIPNDEEQVPNQAPQVPPGGINPLAPLADMEMDFVDHIYEEMD